MRVEGFQMRPLTLYWFVAFLIAFCGVIVPDGADGLWFLIYFQLFMGALSIAQIEMFKKVRG